MAMPGGVETYRHYPSLSSVRRDEREMARKGWKTEGFRVREVARCPLWRVLRRPSHVEVDTHYIRAGWPGLAEH